MAFAPYFDRAAVAAAQVVAGFRETDFRRLLEERSVGIALGADAASAEGRALADLLVRLCARLYPRVAIVDGPRAEALRELALRINPRVELESEADVGIVVGAADASFATPVYAGSDGWIARVSTTRPQAVGDSPLPFGAGAAACLAAANVFRRLLDPAADDEDVTFSSYSGDVDALTGDIAGRPLDLTLVGLGAVGHAAAWALARVPVEGTIALVDHEVVELSNLQRYVLAEFDDVEAAKTAVIARALESSALSVDEYPTRFASFVADRAERRLAAVAAALDSARDRRQVQASLPGLVFNAWTQPGDLGVSVHGRFGGDGACLSCLYLPTDEQRNEDEIVAEALGVPQLQQQVRLLLADGVSAPPELLAAIAEGLGVERAVVTAWENVPLRELYTRGLCGGELVPLERLGAPRAEVHVPLAHQSALAGVLLAAQIARFGTDAPQEMTEIVRLNMMRPVGVALRQPNGADPSGRCICRDRDFTTVYAAKYGFGRTWRVSHQPTASQTPLAPARAQQTREH